MTSYFEDENDLSLPYSSGGVHEMEIDFPPLSKDTSSSQSNQGNFLSSSSRTAKGKEFSPLTGHMAADFSSSLSSSSSSTSTADKIYNSNGNIGKYKMQ